MIVDKVLFVLVLILTALFYPITGYIQGRKNSSILSVNRVDRATWYWVSIKWSWVPILILFFVLIINGLSPKEIGFRLPHYSINRIPPWLFIVAMTLSFLYLAYNIFSIIRLRRSASLREKYAKEIPSNMRYILPITVKEKRMWTLLSLTAGITEEFIYRGYLFYSIPLLFPNIPPLDIVVYTSLLFALGHIYQGKEVIKPTIAGVVLALIYYATGSLYIVILLHAVQDMVAGELLS